MTTFIVVAVGVYALLVGLVLAFGERLLFPAPTPGYAAGELEGFAWVPTGDGAVRLAAVHLRAPGARWTLLYCHGNGEDLASIAPVLRRLQSIGCDVVAWDYRGYGASGGAATVAATLRDVRSVHRWMVEEAGIAAERIVAYGRSVGGGPAVALAAEVPVAGLILESTFVSAYRVVTRLRLLPMDPFPSERTLRQVEAPVLVMHGRRDEVVPFSHGRRLYAAARGPKSKLWLDEATHNDVWVVGWDTAAEAVRRFLESLPEPPPTQ